VSLLEFGLLALATMFVIVDPIALIPTFLSMTEHDTIAHRVSMARLASLVAAGVLIGFGIAGQWIFGLVGITMPAFRIAGGVILFLMAMDMLRARRTEVKETPAEAAAGAAKSDIAVTPLAVPMMAGPGACSTVLLLQTRAESVVQVGLLYAIILLVCYASFVTLWLAAKHADRISPIAMKITTRLMGLLLAAIAVQFILDGVAAHFEPTFAPNGPAAEVAADPATTPAPRAPDAPAAGE